MHGTEIIETWLNENNYSFNKINEPEEFFHYIASVGILKIPIEIFQKKNSNTISIGSQGIMTDILLDTYSKLTVQERESFIQKIQESLTGFKVSYKIPYDYNSFSLVIIEQIPFTEFNKEFLVKTIELVKNASERALGLGTKILQEYRKNQNSGT